MTTLKTNIATAAQAAELNADLIVIISTSKANRMELCSARYSPEQVAAVAVVAGYKVVSKKINRFSCSVVRIVVSQ